MAPHRPPPPDRPVDRSEWIEHREKLLDEALKESFPASDPPSIARPNPRINSRKKKD